jgi:hypothetical protein
MNHMIMNRHLVDEFGKKVVDNVGATEHGDALEITFTDGSVLCVMASGDRLSVKTKALKVCESYYTLGKDRDES